MPGWFALPAMVASRLDVLVEQDRLEEADRLIEDLDLAGPLPDTVPFRLLLYSRGALRLAAGRPADAAADFLELAGREARLRALSTHLVPHRAGAALALAGTGQVDAAREHAAAALASARSWSAPRVVARALRARAVIEPASGAAATLQEVVDLLDPSPARLDEAWLAPTSASPWPAAAGADAGLQLRAALDLGHRCRAAAVERVARAGLVACGYRPRRAAAAGAEALTAAERRVAEMAARGLANRDIAQALFVTERTVELHLTNAYRKLDITSRHQLAASLS